MQLELIQNNFNCETWVLNSRVLIKVGPQIRQADPKTVWKLGTFSKYYQFMVFRNCMSHLQIKHWIAPYFSSILINEFEWTKKNLLERDLNLRPLVDVLVLYQLS